MRRRQVRDAADLLHPRNWRSDPGAAELFRREILRTPAATATLANSQKDWHPLSRPVPSANQPSQLVTVLIPCHNAADSIVNCLDSVRDVADEILVADYGSTDDTLNLARRYGGCRIVEQQTSDCAAFEDWAHTQARHPWILRILPDEELNSELGRQVQDTIAAEPKEHGFRISRSLSFHGERLKHGGFEDDASIRLYRKDAARCALRHGRVEVCVDDAKIGRLRARLVRESCRSVEQLVAEMTRLAGVAAYAAQQNGLRPRRWNVLWRAPAQFLRSYVLHSGWLDGWAGLHASFFSAFAVYLRETLLWEMQLPPARRSLVHDEPYQLRIFDPRGDSSPEAPAAKATYTASVLESPADGVADPRRYRAAA
jgi:hypothetical protein